MRPAPRVLRELLVSPDSRKAAYHAAMRRKYEDAAACPWFPVAPDPPEP